MHSSTRRQLVVLTSAAAALGVVVVLCVRWHRIPIESQAAARKARVDLGRAQTTRDVPVLLNALIEEIELIPDDEAIISGNPLSARGQRVQQALERIGQPATLPVLRELRDKEGLDYLLLFRTLSRIHPNRERSRRIDVLERLRDGVHQSEEIRRIAAELLAR